MLHKLKILINQSKKISLLTPPIFLVQLGFEQGSFILLLILVEEELCSKGKKEHKFVLDVVHK
jgi:hypothetical protein